MVGHVVDGPVPPLKREYDGNAMGTAMALDKYPQKGPNIHILPPRVGRAGVQVRQGLGVGSGPCDYAWESDDGANDICRACRGAQNPIGLGVPKLGGTCSQHLLCSSIGEGENVDVLVDPGDGVFDNSRHESRGGGGSERP